MRAIHTLLFAAAISTSMGCVTEPDGPGALEIGAASGKEDGVVGNISYRTMDATGLGYGAKGTSQVRAPSPETLEVIGPMVVLSPPAGFGFDISLDQSEHPSQFMLFVRPANTPQWHNLSIWGNQDNPDIPLTLFTSASMDQSMTLYFEYENQYKTNVDPSYPVPWRDGKAWQFGMLVVPDGTPTAELERRDWSLEFTCGNDWRC